MLVADLDEHRIISDTELKERICKRKPYREWLDRNALTIDDLPKIKTEVTNKLPLHTRQIAFGMSLEDEGLILSSMITDAKEPIGSMGADIPLAVLSKISQHISNYFKQQFAQCNQPTNRFFERELLYVPLHCLVQ